MADKIKKSFFESRLMRSKIKSQTVSLFPEAALGYLLGPILALLCNGVVNIWLVQYWDKVLGMEQWNSLFQTLVPLISAIVIIIGNVFVGKLMERKPTLAGKARPLILIGMPIIAVALLVLFIAKVPNIALEENVIAGSTSRDGCLLISILVAVGYNLFYAIAWPLYYTSHSALVNLSTRDGGKRGLLGTAVMAAQLAAAGVSGMFGGFLVDWLGLIPKYTYTQAGILKMETITGKSLGDITSTNSFKSIMDNGLLEDSDYTVSISRQQANQKWLVLMIVMIVALILGCLLEYFFTRERITEEAVNKAEAMAQNADAKETKKKVTIGEQIKICVKDKFWWMIMIFWFLYQFGGMMKNNDMSFFSESLTNGYSVSSIINTVGAVPTALGMVIVWPLASKLTKSRTIAFGGIVAFLAGAAAFSCLGFVGNVGAITGISVASFCVKALGTAPAMYISLALMANVLDHQEAVHGVRTDGFTMAVYGSIMVSMSGICNGVIMGLKSVVPADGQAFLHTFLAFGVEAICYLLIAVIFIFMKVEKFTNVDNKAIVADQKAEVLAAGGNWIEPEERARLEEEENDRLVVEAHLDQLKLDCEKKNKDYAAEEKKYLEQHNNELAAAAKKKADAEAKRAAKEAALPAAVIEKRKQNDQKALEELNAVRAKFGKPEVSL